MMERTRRYEIVRCFTLIEALLVVSIVAILLAMLLPSLGRARVTAATTKVHAVAGSLGAATLLYSGDHRGHLPYLGVPGRPWEGAWIDGERPDVSYLLSDPPSYFSQSTLYANLLCDGYFDGRASLLYAAFVDEASGDRHFVTPYLMTLGAFAAPSYWIGETPPETLSVYRAVGFHEAAFPSAKGLILHSGSGVFHPNPRLATDNLNVCLVDGSAGSRVAESTMWDRVVSRPYGGMPLPVVNTPAGLAGRDFSPGP